MGNENMDIMTLFAGLGLTMAVAYSARLLWRRRKASTAWPGNEPVPVFQSVTDQDVVAAFTRLRENRKWPYTN
jgi:hypothetical protein